jgi:hypothetical protein
VKCWAPSVTGWCRNRKCFEKAAIARFSVFFVASVASCYFFLASPSVPRNGQKAPAFCFSVLSVASCYFVLACRLLKSKPGARGEKARRLLGWTPRPNEEVIVATAESLEKRGLLKESTKKALNVFLSLVSSAEIWEICGLNSPLGSRLSTSALSFLPAIVFRLSALGHKPNCRLRRYGLGRLGLQVVLGHRFGL